MHSTTQADVEVYLRWDYNKECLKSLLLTFFHTRPFKKGVPIISGSGDSITESELSAL